MNEQRYLVLEGENAVHRPALEITNREFVQIVGTVLPHARRAHTIDIIVCKDGKETRYEGDWIKRLQFPHVKLEKE